MWVDACNRLSNPFWYTKARRLPFPEFQVERTGKKSLYTIEQRTESRSSWGDPIIGVITQRKREPSTMLLRMNLHPRKKRGAVEMDCKSRSRKSCGEHSFFWSCKCIRYHIIPHSVSEASAKSVIHVSHHLGHYIAFYTMSIEVNRSILISILGLEAFEIW